MAFDRTIVSPIPADHLIKVLKTTNSGTTWEVYDVEEAIGRLSFDIWGVDGNTAFITTQDYNSGAGRGIFKTEDGGINWTEKLNGVAGGVWIRFFNEEDGIAINLSAMATTDDGGESWDPVPLGNFPEFGADEFTLIASGSNSCHVVDDHIWFGTSKGRVYRSNDKGKHWEADLASLGTDALIMSVAFKDTLNGIALKANSPLFTLFSVTSDGGQTWEDQAADPFFFVENLAVIPGTEDGLIGTTNLQSIGQYVSVYSTDFGKNWEILTENIPFGGTSFSSPTAGWTSRGIIEEKGQSAMFKWIPGPVGSFEAQESKSITVFPNPFTESIQLYGIEQEAIQYKVLSNDGHLIYYGTLEEDASIKGLSDLPPGMYLLEFAINEKRYTRKVIKAQ